MSDFNVVEIKTYAAGSFGDPVYNGYYTWPLLGYDAPLTAAEIAALPLELASARSVLDLMASETGRLWWKTNGNARTMIFDLSAGSRSRQALQTYLDKKGVKL